MVTISLYLIIGLLVAVSHRRVIKIAAWTLYKDEGRERSFFTFEFIHAIVFACSFILWPSCIYDYYFKRD